ncbi:MAG: preprotein translocase subunit YajC [Micavibrio sp.]|jgi:preprotein translocase subunit YajC
MLISVAHAAGEAVAATPPGAGQAFMMNMGLILILVVLFYVLLIIPQQRRFKEHRAMIDSMKKGDKVLTAAGFIGTVDSVNTEKGEVVVDLGHGVKVTALRATIQTRIDDKK